MTESIQFTNSTKRIGRARLVQIPKRLSSTSSNDSDSRQSKPVYDLMAHRPGPTFVHQAATSLGRCASIKPHIDTCSPLSVCSSRSSGSWRAPSRQRISRQSHSVRRGRVPVAWIYPTKDTRLSPQLETGTSLSPTGVHVLAPHERDPDAFTHESSDAVKRLYDRYDGNAQTTTAEESGITSSSPDSVDHLGSRREGSFSHFATPGRQLRTSADVFNRDSSYSEDDWQQAGQESPIHPTASDWDFGFERPVETAEIGDWDDLKSRRSSWYSKASDLGEFLRDQLISTYSTLRNGISSAFDLSRQYSPKREFATSVYGPPSKFATSVKDRLTSFVSAPTSSLSLRFGATTDGSGPDHAADTPPIMLSY